MKTIFVVNPKAGQGKNTKKIIDSIKETAERLEAEVEIYTTKAAGDAERFVREYCKNNDAARFIACGGDGTLSEVLNGAIEFETAEVGIIPNGTGNDFCRNFEFDFKDVESQIKGNAVKCDAIKYSSAERKGYCVNMFNIGFDCNVADMTARMKTKPFVSGSLAYFLSIFVNLVGKKGANLKIELDGKRVYDGALLLMSIANGSYCGGGVKSNPLACVQDGFINVNIIKNVSRLRLLTLLPHYMKGTHLKLRNIEKYISTLSCKKITVTPLDSKMRLCNDGEITDADKTDFEIVHNAFNFVMPSKIVKTESKEKLLV